MPTFRRASLTAALAAAPFALAYRFALIYRRRAGFPRPHRPIVNPAALGLAFEEVSVPAEGTNGLPGWFMPARGGERGPGVVLVHGWESARDRTLPIAQFLVAAGFHCLAVDVRGHGDNPPETLPVSAGEFGTDALAAFHALIARPEVTVGAISGHSMGAIGAILAGAADERVTAIVATSSPADPYRLTRQTFRLAHLPIPDVIAYPLAWLTTRVYLRPRGHQVGMISAAAALVSHERPVLLIHGDLDVVVPYAHLARLRRTAERAGRPVESLTIPGGQHSWLYEFPEYRRAVAAFLARCLGGPYEPDRCGRPRGRRGGCPDPGWRGPVRCRGGRARRLPIAGRAGAPRPTSRGCYARAGRRDPDRGRLMNAERELSVWQAVQTKRAVRTFTDQPLEPRHLDRILHAGRRSGSSKNFQRWEFIVCRDRDHLRELAKVGMYADHLAGAAVAIALVTPRSEAADDPLSVMFDLGQAAAYMMLAAWELGIGSVPATVYEPDLARRLLGYPASHHCEYLLSFGYPADASQLTAPNRPGRRRPLSEMVHEERW